MAVLRQNDGSFYLSGLVLSDAADSPHMARAICAELLEVIRSGTVLPKMVALQFAPTPYDFNCSPYTCEHKQPLVNHYGMPQCTVCKKTLEGWFCPKSPDQQCHYHTDGAKSGKFQVELRDGSMYEFDKHPDEDQYESEDWCLFCGNPEERK